MSALGQKRSSRLTRRPRIDEPARIFLRIADSDPNWELKPSPGTVVSQENQKTPGPELSELGRRVTWRRPKSASGGGGILAASLGRCAGQRDDVRLLFNRLPVGQLTIAFDVRRPSEQVALRFIAILFF